MPVAPLNLLILVATTPSSYCVAISPEALRVIPVIEGPVFPVFPALPVLPCAPVGPIGPDIPVFPVNPDIFGFINGLLP